MKLYPFILIILTFFWGCKNDSRHQYTGVLEGTAVKVPALVGGQILALYVDSGDQVVKEQKIAVIDSTELVFQWQQLQANLLEIQIQQEIARTAFDKATTDLAYVQEKYDRVAQLYQKNSAPRQNLDDAQNQLQAVTASHRSARQNLQSLVARQQQVQAQLNLANKKIHDTVILSPRSGIIATKYYETGEAVMPLNPVVEIIDIRSIETKIYINETQLAQVAYGQTVRVVVDGLEKNMIGQVNWISPKAEFTPKSILTPETRTSLVYAVKISIDNPEGKLKHGMPVVIELQYSGR